MFPDMGLWVYYREIYGGHGADCQTQKDILEASAYMSQTPLKRKNHSDQQISFWKIFEVYGWPFLTLDWPDFSSVGIGKVRWGRREELLITPHSYISLQQTNSLR